MNKSFLISLAASVLLLSPPVSAAPIQDLPVQQVQDIQSFLKQEGFFTFPTITGYFGPITYAALKAFQIKHNLSPTGLIDKSTALKVKKVSTPHGGKGDGGGGGTGRERHNTNHSTNAPQPTVFSDFKNGVYRINGVSKTLGEVWEENEDWWDWDPSEISPGVGLAHSGGSRSGPVLNPDLVAEHFSEDALVVIYWRAPGGVGVGSNSIMSIDYTDLPNYDREQYFTATRNGALLLRDFVNPDAVDSWTGSNVHKSAIILSNALFVASTNGGAIVSMDPADGSPNSIGLEVSADGIIEKIEFFAPDAYTAEDLPTLSAL